MTHIVVLFFPIHVVELYNTSCNVDATFCWNSLYRSSGKQSPYKKKHMSIISIVGYSLSFLIALFHVYFLVLEMVCTESLFYAPIFSLYLCNSSFGEAKQQKSFA